MSTPSEAGHNALAMISIARQTLIDNDRGGYTVPTAGLYPFQWNWDAGVTALGWMTLAKTLGIRPEDLELTADGLELDAKVVEVLGASQQVNSRIGDELIRVSCPASPTIAAGSKIRVRARAAQVRWYDAQGGLIAS